MRPKRSPAPTGRHRGIPLDRGAPDDSKAAKTFAGSASNAAKPFPGSAARPRFSATVYREAITEKLDAGLSVQRIWQDLVEEYGYGASYESVKRFVRTIAPTRRAVGVFHCAPGAEAQVDFFRGAPTLDAATGEWRRPWVFRMTLGHSRHGYEEAVWDQKLATFLALHERAFRDFGGVPAVIRHDNLKAAVVRACFYDPDSHDVYVAFAAHWGFTPLPTQPRRPQENGKQERSGGYVKSNALKGRRFDSLDAHNAFLRHWNRTIARLRIHGTTRRQVWTHFVEVGAASAAAAGRRRVSVLHDRRPDGAYRWSRRSGRRVLSRAARVARAAAPRALGHTPRPRLPGGHARGGPRTGARGRLCAARRARPRPRRASKRMSIASSASVRAWAPRSSSGPPPRS